MFDVVYCGKDLDFQRSIFDNLPHERYKVTNIRSTLALAGYLSTHKAEVIVIDEHIFTSEGFNNISSVPLSKLQKKATWSTHKSKVLLISENNKTIRNLEKKYKNMYFFNREELFADKFSSFIQCADNFKLIPILISEIELNSVFNHDLFFTGESNSTNQFFLKKKTVFSAKIMSLTKKKGIQHLYLKEEESNDFFGSHKNFIKTTELLKLRSELQGILLNILDDTGINSQLNGKMILEKIANLSTKIEKIVKKCESLEEAFRILPFPRLNLTSQSLNLAIYAAILSQKVLKKKDLSLVSAALLSKIGSVNWGAGLIEQDHFGLREEKAMENKLEILRAKSLFRDERLIQYIELENENILGTGFPSGKILSFNEFEFQLLSLCKLIQRKREIRNGEFEKITSDVFRDILEKSARINPQLLEKIKDLF